MNFETLLAAGAKKVGSNIYCVTDRIAIDVDDFYNELTFPDYRNDDTLASLAERVSTQKIFEELSGLKRFGGAILEVGCGTGQLSNVLAGGSNNLVVGLDGTLASLKKAEKFAIDNGIKNVRFLNGSLFDDIFKPEVFDVLVCSGVLHHTGDPKGGFANIARWVKKDGYILLGLYHKYGRLQTNARQIILKGARGIFGERGAFALATWLCPMLRKWSKQDKANNGDKIKSWYHDQYEHPIESKHTIREAIHWFGENGFDFVGSVPSPNPFSQEFSLLSRDLPVQPDHLKAAEFLFTFDRLAQEGGLFWVLGKKVR